MNLAPSDARAGLEGVTAPTRTKLAIMHSPECRQYPFIVTHKFTFYKGLSEVSEHRHEAI